MNQEDHRLHLQEGPINLILDVDAFKDIREHLFISAKKRVSTVLRELVLELDLLKLPWKIHSPVPKGEIAKRMFYAVSDLDVFVTPMAAVAGAVADEILDVMRKTVENSDYYLDNVKRMYVNNGGDLSFWLKNGSSFSVGVIDNIETPELNTKVSLHHESPVRGIATSGWRGRSQSLGIADAVTVLAKSAVEADVAATLIANDVNIEYPGIEKRPASELKDDSDLGSMPVTVDVPSLPDFMVSEALNKGAKTARKFINMGIIETAYLSLQKQTLVVEKNNNEKSNERSNKS